MVLALTEDLKVFIIDWDSSDVPVADDSDDESSQSQSQSHSASDKQKNWKAYDDQFVIKGFGVDAQGNSVTINITDFKPYFFIKIPDTWENNIATVFINGLKNLVHKSFRDTLREWKLINSKPFYYFSGDARYKFKFIRLTFDSHKGFNQYEYILKEKIKIYGINGNIPMIYDRYESNILPLLRFIHTNDLNATGWVNLPHGKYVKTVINNTTCKQNVTINYKDVQKLDVDDIPPLKYMSYDIECDSSHGDFPIADKDYLKLSRDLITEYNRLHDEAKAYKKEHKRTNNLDIRATMGKLVELAFNPNFNNNNIRSVKTVDNQKPSAEILDYVTDQFISIINAPDMQCMSYEEPDKQSALLELFELNFPLLIENAEVDYYSLADQLIKDCTRLQKNNNIRYRDHQREVVRFLLELVFDDYYDNNTINNVYPVNTVLPDKRKIQCLVPTICEICHDCRQLISSEKHKKRTKLKPGEVKIGQDHFVDKLNKLFSDHFPKLLGDSIIQIGSVIKKYGDNDPYLKHIITLGSCSRIENTKLIDDEHKDVTLADSDIIAEICKLPNFTGKSKDELLKQLNSTPETKQEFNALALEQRKLRQYKTDKSEVIVESYETEREVLLAWIKLVKKTDPDLIIGYNILGFDFRYLHGRAKMLGIENEFNTIGRIEWVPGKAGKKDVCILKEQKLSSSGLGDNTLYYLQMFGRVCIDLYKVAQSSFNLDSYKLDYVCKKYLGKSKNDLPPSEIFIKQKGTSDDRRIIAEYCLIDCILVTRFIDKLDIIINTIGMSRVCSVPFSFLFLRGQGIKLLSFVSKICRKKGYLIPVLKKDDDGDNNESYEGAIVLNAQSDIYYKAIAVADFNSLYPSCMISENLSHDSYVGFKVVQKGENTNYRDIALNPDNEFEKKLLAGDFPGWDYVDIIYDVYEYIPVAPGRKKKQKIVTAHKICRFAQPPNSNKSVIPNILQELLDARASTRQKQKNFPKGSFQYNVLEGLQLAYKVTANSLYGQIGASTSAIFLMDIAACTTATGRNLIKFSKNHCEKNYDAQVVYGDTDSIFIKFVTRDMYDNELFGLDAIYKSMELCIEAAISISRQLKKPHNLDFEKAIWPFVLVSKKRYHGHYFTLYAEPKYDAKSMGIVLKRRDNANIVKHIFGGMMKIIMEKHSITDAVQFVKDECKKLLDGKFPMEFFVLTKTLRSYYKSPDQIAHNVLAQRIGKRDPGNKPQGNDRIAFAHIRVNNQDCLQGDKIETPDFIKDHNLFLDYRHYLTNQIMKPVTQIIELVLNNADALFNNILVDYDNGLIGVQKLTKYSNITLKKIDCVSSKELHVRYLTDKEKREFLLKEHGEFEDDYVIDKQITSETESEIDEETDDEDIEEII